MEVLSGERMNVCLPSSSSSVLSISSMSESDRDKGTKVPLDSADNIVMTKGLVVDRPICSMMSRSDFFFFLEDNFLRMNCFDS